MKYLLDTHVLIWVAMAKNKVSKNVAQLLVQGDSDFYISQISIWEISLKYALHKLDLRGTNPDDLLINSKAHGFKILRIRTSVASTFYRLPKYSNKDPFDRMLTWQAINENMIFISEDKKFDDYKKEGLKRIW